MRRYPRMATLQERQSEPASCVPQRQIRARASSIRSQSHTERTRGGRLNSACDGGLGERVDRRCVRCLPQFYPRTTAVYTNSPARLQPLARGGSFREKASSPSSISTGTFSRLRSAMITMSIATALTSSTASTSSCRRMRPRSSTAVEPNIQPIAVNSAPQLQQLMPLPTRYWTTGMPAAPHAMGSGIRAPYA